GKSGRVFPRSLSPISRFGHRDAIFLMLHQRTDAIRYPHETEDGSTKEVRLGCVLLPHQDDYDNSRTLGYVIIKR
ncbi:hypothetical protein PENTCL1PPCAC_24058, partial [Pristionchus entomophagus]